MGGLLTASIPFAAMGILGFTWYAFDRRRGIFMVATLTSLIAFLILSALLAGIAVVNGPGELIARGARYNGMAWVLMLTYFLAEYRYRIRELGTILMPVALTLMILSVFDRRAGGDPYPFASVPVLIHLAFVFMGLAMVFLAFAGAALYLIRTRTLRHPGQADFSSRLPSLSSLDRVMTSALTAGFPLFTVGLILGILYAGTSLKAGWWQQPKIIAGVLSWILYAAVVFFYHRRTLTNRRLAHATIVLFVACVVSFTLASHRSLQPPAPPASPVVETPGSPGA